MSIYYSKFGLNTYWGAKFWTENLPEGYSLSLVMQKCQSFNNLPKNLKKLATLTKQWCAKNAPMYLDLMSEAYDDEGYELNLQTGERLTPEEIAREWEPHNPDIDDFEVVDIPVPEGGFPDPDTWTPAPEPEEEEDQDDIVTGKRLLAEIGSHGREYTARYYYIPKEQAAQAKSDGALAKMILKEMGRNWDGKSIKKSAKTA